MEEGSMVMHLQAKEPQSRQQELEELRKDFAQIWWRITDLSIDCCRSLSIYSLPFLPTFKPQ